MGLIYATKIQNQSYTHANLSMLPYLLHRFIVDDLKRLLLQNGYPQGIIFFNINDVMNNSKNKPNEPVATFPKIYVIVLLPFIGLHSNLITKRPKSCVNRFYSFVNV